jgi:two-component system, chemotaxis family, protein-glutamate methylesterase/glutaminase
MPSKVGVLVVDDSPLIRQLIIDALTTDPDIEILGTASNGVEAIEQVKRLKPHVVTMDVDMPVMNGIEATERIMGECPTPILVLTADPRREAPALTHQALAAGALALQVKPALDTKNENWRLAAEVKLLSSVKVILHLKGNRRHSGISSASVVQPVAAPSGPCPFGVVGVVGSTGGPQVLQKLVSGLPKEFPAALVVVQHINSAFADSLVTWLQSTSKMLVKRADHGDALLPGTVYLAPPDRHLIVARGKLSLELGPAKSGHIPSGTLMLESMAQAYGRRCVGVVLTGMGTDGADGMVALRAAGGTTLIQSQDSSVVFGMPGAALSRGAAEFSVHADDFSRVLLSLSRNETASGLHRPSQE